MATIVTRAAKGSPLTHVEVDANFTNLNTDKAESSALATVATSGAYADLTGTPTAYTDAAVDTHLNTSTATTGEVLSWSGTDYDWTTNGPTLFVESSGTATAPNSSDSVAIGGYAVSSGTNSTALGRANAGGTDSFAAAIGTAAATYGAQGYGSISIGTLSKATQIAGTAVGYGATSTHQASSAFGTSATTTANNQIALGGSGITARISGAYTLPAADGTNGQILVTNGSGALSFATNTGSYSDADVDTHLNTGTATTGEVLSWTGTDYDWIAAGGGGAALELYAENPSSPTAPSATGANAVAIGSGSTSTNVQTVAIGNGAQATAYGSLALGGLTDLSFGAKASGNGSIAIGVDASAAGLYSSAIGYKSRAATNAYAVAFTNSYASGADSLAAAIANNSSSYGATGANSVAIGYQAKASAFSGFAFGYQNQSTANYAVTVGRNNVGSSQYSLAIGYEATTRATPSIAFAAGSFSGIAGQHQSSMFALRARTTDATPRVLNSDGGTGGSTNDQIILPNNAAFAFHGTIVARQQASQGTACAAWKIEGLIRREGSAGTTVLVNSATTVLDNTPAWGMALSADTTNGGLKIEVTGAAATNIAWNGNIHTSEVTY